MQTNTNNSSWKLVSSGDKQSSSSFLCNSESACTWEQEWKKHSTTHTHTRILSADHQQMLIQQLQLEHSNPTPATKHQKGRFYCVSPNSLSQSLHWPSQLFSVTSVSLELCCVEPLLSAGNVSLIAASATPTAIALHIFGVISCYSEWESIAL